MTPIECRDEIELFLREHSFNVSVHQKELRRLLVRYATVYGEEMAYDLKVLQKFIKEHRCK